ncbi:MAG: hypothetical protein L0Z50_30820 [Verrucomicrobiales bacterium]|nr:hypothetical protein [Verrucomicrobiales bacterium]
MNTTCGTTEGKLALPAYFGPRNGLSIVLVATLLSFCFEPAQANAAGDELKPTNSIPVILTAFDLYPIVAIGDNHGCEEEWDFITSLVRTAEFPNRVNDIGVEFGNALYQDVCDRYIAGQDVPSADVQKIWRNTTGFIAWDSPVYEQFFVTVRDVNKKLPAEKRLRVLLGDPPLDWSITPDSKLKQEWGRAMFRRDSHFAGVVEKEILAKGRKALLISGGAHFVRGVSTNNTTGHIERLRPHSMFIVIPHSGFKERNEELEARLASWKPGMIASIKGTWLGALHPRLRWPQMAGAKFKVPDSPNREPRLEDVADAWLFVGMRDSLTEVLPHPRIYRDDYWNELNRRHLIAYGKRIDDPDNVQAEFNTSARYYVKPK